MTKEFNRFLKNRKWAKVIWDYEDVVDEPDIIPLYGLDCYDEGLLHGVILSAIITGAICIFIIGKKIKNKKNKKETKNDS